MHRITVVTGTCSVLGGAAWTVACFAQNTLPQGCIGDGCDTRPMRGSSVTATAVGTVGFVCLAVAAVGLLLLSREGATLGGAARAGLVTGAAGMGLLVVAQVVSWLANDWEGMPGLVVPGVVLLVAGFAILAWTVLRSGVLPRWLAVLLLATAVLMLGANEQTTRILLAVPFGLTWVLVGAVLLRRGRAAEQESGRTAAGSRA